MAKRYCKNTVALVTTMSMKADPIFRKAKEQNVETIQSTPMQQG